MKPNSSEKSGAAASQRRRLTVTDNGGKVDFTVAHESAHIVLGHYTLGATAHPAVLPPHSHEEAPSEQQADSLAESWGFKKPKRQVKA